MNSINALIRLYVSISEGKSECAKLKKEQRRANDTRVGYRTTSKLAFRFEKLFAPCHNTAIPNRTSFSLWRVALHHTFVPFCSSFRRFSNFGLELESVDNIEKIFYLLFYFSFNLTITIRNSVSRHLWNIYDFSYMNIQQNNVLKNSKFIKLQQRNSTFLKFQY